MDADFVRVGDAIVILVAVVFEVDSSFARVLAEQIGVAILVAGGDQLFQLQLLEVVGEVVKEIANLGIIAVAQDSLVLEMLDVMPQLLLDVGKLGVKLVLLVALAACRLRFNGLIGILRDFLRYRGSWPNQLLSERLSEISINLIVWSILK